MHSLGNPLRGDILLKILLPLGFLAVALVFTYFVILLRPDPETKALEKVLPAVEVSLLTSGPLALKINSQGTVQARTETVLVAEVSGVIEYVAPRLFSGRFFKKGDVLLEIDKIEYEAALANARGMLANAKLAYAQEENLSEQARLDWRELGRGQPNDLVLRKPQLEKALADLEAAKAAVALAERNLAKTTVRAPYDGRVHTKMVDVGQMVNARMTQLARIFSVDAAEVRLPISSEEAGFIDLPDAIGDGEIRRPDSKVVLSSTIGQTTWSWEGVIDRVEGVIDAATRQVYLVARVDDPYSQEDNPNRPPLKVGQFVAAEIAGRDLGRGFIIPRAALKPNDVVWIIDNRNRLRITPVEVAKAGVDQVYITAGLQDGDLLCLTQLGIVVDGMEVEIEGELPGGIGEAVQ